MGLPERLEAPWSSLLLAFSNLRLEVFLAAFIWLFVRDFPAAPMSFRLRHRLGDLIRVLWAVGAVLLVAELYYLAGFFRETGPGRDFTLVPTRVFVITLGLAGPQQPGLEGARPPDRPRRLPGLADRPCEPSRARRGERRAPRRRTGAGAARRRVEPPRPPGARAEASGDRSDLLELAVSRLARNRAPLARRFPDPAPGAHLHHERTLERRHLAERQARRPALRDRGPRPPEHRGLGGGPRHRAPGAETPGEGDRDGRRGDPREQPQGFTPRLADILDKIRAADVPDIREQVPGCPDSLSRFFRYELHRDKKRRSQSGGEYFSRLRRVWRELGSTSGTYPAPVARVS